MAAFPDVFEYLDYRAFLRDAYEAGRGRRGWSFRALAQRARIRSSSFLKRVMDGERNLAEPTAERVARAVGLVDDASEFFVSLVRFNQAATSRERSEAYARLHRFEAYRRARPLEAERDAYHARWYHPAIRELSTSPHFRPDPEWIASVLRPPIRAREAAEALRTLERLDLLGGAGDDRAPLVTSGRETGSVHMARYHRAMMERASEAIDEVPREERDIASITVCVGRGELARLKRRVQEMRAELLAEFGASDDGDQVVQLNVQLFPLTRRLQEEKE